MSFQKLDEIVRTWIGLSHLPPAEVIANSGWRADDPESYCGRCGESVGLGEAGSDGCATCRGGGRLGDRFVRLGVFAADLRVWVLRLKYGAWWEMGDELGRRLGFAVRDALPPVRNEPVVIPVPMPWQRRLYRGVDHARVIAEAVTKRVQGRFVPILGKRNGPLQVSLSPSERLRGTGSIVFVRRQFRKLDLSETPIVIVDDVRTTGGTLRRAAAAIRRLGARDITVAVVAVSDEKARRLRDNSIALGSESPTREIQTIPVANEKSDVEKRRNG